MRRLILTCCVCTLASATLVVLGGCRGGEAGLGAGTLVIEPWDDERVAAAREEERAQWERLGVAEE